MSAKPRVVVLRAAGVNCETETAHAWHLAGALPDIVHFNRLREHPGLLHDYQMLTIPGGFSYGDDISAGKIFALQLRQFLGSALAEYTQKDRLVLGICNGFQVLCKAGLLPGRNGGDVVFPAVTITTNRSGQYEDRWVSLQRMTSRCAFLGLRSAFELPVAHGEGRVLCRSLEGMQQLQARGCVALRYVSRDGGAVEYPENPNGSMLDVAGLCDPGGRIFGLMPHPERYVDPAHHPHWTDRQERQPHGRAIFESAVAHFE